MYPQLDKGMQNRLHKINRTDNYYIFEIRERETMIKTLSKCIATFDFF